MNKKMVGFLVAAMLMLVASGCRSAAELPEPDALEREVCQDNNFALPGGRGTVESSECGARTVLVKRTPHEWVPANVDTFDGHIVLSVEVNHPPDGLWEWDQGLYLVPPSNKRYWLENLDVVQGPKSRSVVEEWWVPNSHLACRQAESSLGTISCEVAIATKAMVEQVSSNSYGIMATVELHTPKVPVAPVQKKVGVELSGEFQKTLVTSKNREHATRVPLNPPEGTTGYITVANVWNIYETKVTFIGDLCYRDSSGSKACQSGWKTPATLTSINHEGLKPFKNRLPLGEEEGPIPNVRHSITQGEDERIVGTWELYFSSTISRKSSAMNTGRAKVYGEIDTAVTKVGGAVTASISSGDASGVEVKYSTTLKATPAPGVQEFYIWEGKSLFAEGDSITSRGPFFDSQER